MSTCHRCTYHVDIAGEERCVAHDAIGYCPEDEYAHILAMPRENPCEDCPIGVRMDYDTGCAECRIGADPDGDTCDARDGYENRLDLRIDYAMED